METIAVKINMVSFACRFWIHLIILILLLPASSTAQQLHDTADTLTADKSLKANSCFEKEEALELTIQGNIKALCSDRTDNAPGYPLNILYINNNGQAVNLPVHAKTRGHFRRMWGNCQYPPLLLNFKKCEAKNNSIFTNIDKVKLVMPCTGDEYVVREWLAYKLYNLLTPVSLNTRLVRIKLEDTKTGKHIKPFYGLLLEEEKKMCKRNGILSVTKKMNPEETDQYSFLTMAVFQYLIGNTDWSVQYMQNILLVAKDSNSTEATVPYDFDHAGLINAPYSKPAEALELSSVLERRYRGYCLQNMEELDTVLAHFNNLKKNIYALYADCGLIDKHYKNFVVKYLDEFYKTINDPIELKKEFGYPCNKNGTGNVIIKGMGKKIE